MRPDADLTPAGLARLVADFLIALDLPSTLVGNDTGGANFSDHSGRHPERSGGWYDQLRRLPQTSCRRRSGAAAASSHPRGCVALAKTAHLAPVRVASACLPATRSRPTSTAGWADPIRTTPGFRRDVAKVLRGTPTRETMRAIGDPARIRPPNADRLGPQGPVLRRANSPNGLPADIPGARLEWLPDAHTFTPLDAPEQLAALITEFAADKAVPRA